MTARRRRIAEVGEHRWLRALLAGLSGSTETEPSRCRFDGPKQPLPERQVFGTPEAEQRRPEPARLEQPRKLEGAVVALVVVRPQAGRAVVGAAGREGRGVERVDGRGVRHDERDVRRGRGRAPLAEPEVRLVAVAENRGQTQPLLGGERWGCRLDAAATIEPGDGDAAQQQDQRWPAP